MNEQTLEQAADWVDRVNDLNEDESAELSLWLKQPENKAAFDRVAKIFGDPSIDKALHNLHTYHNDTSITPLKKNANKQKSFHKIAIAASFSAIAFMAYWFSLPQQEASITPTIASNDKFEPVKAINAPIGKRVSKLLTDGTYLHLNAGSELTAKLQPNVRKVVLNKGQVFFDVAKDKKRPFVIDSGEANITVLGTSFDVQHNENKVVVTVYEGKVKVNAKDTVTLIPPQKAVVVDGRITVTTDKSLEQLPLWRTGWIEAEKETLDSIVEQLQRYSNDKIKLDSKLSNTIISGRFNLETPKQSLMLIADAYNLKLEVKQNILLISRI
ncbi:FecR domain-containing protein [Pseudoalteromonas sp. Angola-30]|uniref:FecR family protein n=1 Tax=Pseudoalteromonas sp. Angola-30 TaxID=3025341 RepID=UPI002358EFF9|nr:FecR family protein [Pseudoalteromonas sp. Angola-30]MDC9526780.1 FecR domain-containing protein [Pseudoalteromonas sp. Angola-30]